MIVWFFSLSEWLIYFYLSYINQVKEDFLLSVCYGKENQEFHHTSDICHNMKGYHFDILSYCDRVSILFNLVNILQYVTVKNVINANHLLMGHDI